MGPPCDEPLLSDPPWEPPPPPGDCGVPPPCEPAVVPDADVYQAALDLVARYANGPAVALRAAKQAIDDGLDVDLDTGLEIERLLFAGLFATEDQRTGMRSFVENGPGKAMFAGR